MLRKIDLKASKQYLKLSTVMHQVHSYGGKVHPCMYVLCLYVLEENFFVYMFHSSFYAVTMKINNKIARYTFLTVKKAKFANP